MNIEDVDAEIEMALLNMVGRIPGHELDYARQSWDLFRDQRSEGPEKLIIGVGDNTRCEVVELVQEHAAACAKITASIMDAAGEDNMSATLCLCVREWLKMKMKRDTGHERLAFDAMIGLIWWMHLRRPRAAQPRAPSARLSIYVHVLRQIGQGGDGLLFLSFWRVPSCEIP